MNYNIFGILPLWLALDERLCVESYPRLSLSVSVGKLLGKAVRCLNVQWTSLTPGQLQLRGQDGTP